MLSKEINCVWLEDNGSEIADIVSQLRGKGWNISICKNLVDFENFCKNNIKWDVVGVDGRMLIDEGEQSEEGGKIFFEDLRAGKFGEWGKEAKVILYSGIAEILDKAVNNPWGNPQPEVISKNDSTNEVVKRFISIGIQVLDYKGNVNNNLTKTMLHFGTGRIGLGFVLPLVYDASSLQESRKIILTNRISSDSGKKFQSMLAGEDSKNVPINIGHQVIPCLLVRITEINCNELVLKINECKTNVIALFDFECQAILKQLIAISDLASFSLGKNLEDIALNVAKMWSSSKPCNAIAFENDHDRVRSVAKKINLINNKFDLRSAVVDRIVSDFDITTSISVWAEPTYSCYVEDVGSVGHFFKGHPKLQFASSKKHFDFFHLRKKILMNTMHLIVSVIRANHVIEHVRSIAQFEQQVLSTIVETDSEKEMYKTIGSLLSIYLLKKLDDETKNIAFGFKDEARMRSELNREVRKTIDRVSMVSDRVGRVVGMKVVDFEAKIINLIDPPLLDINKNIKYYYSFLNPRIFKLKLIQERVNNIDVAAQNVRRRLASLSLQ